MHTLGEMNTKNVQQQTMKLDMCIINLLERFKLFKNIFLAKKILLCLFMFLISTKKERVIELIGINYFS